jgi:hypothetical protein
MVDAHYPDALTDFPYQDLRFRGRCDGLMRRLTVLTGVPRGPTSCAWDATLCNGDSTLSHRRPTRVTVPLTERSPERVSPPSIRTPRPDDRTRFTAGLTVPVRRLTPSSAAITLRAECVTAVRQRVTPRAQGRTAGGSEFTAHWRRRTVDRRSHTCRRSRITVHARESTSGSHEPTDYRQAPTHGMMILTSRTPVPTPCAWSARNRQPRQRRLHRHLPREHS